MDSRIVGRECGKVKCDIGVVGLEEEKRRRRKLKSDIIVVKAKSCCSPIFNL